MVGGSIRDALLNIPTYDWDITTNATPKQVSKLFKKVIPTGIKYGTVTVLMDKIPYEVTTFRADEKYSDGRHPDKVKFAKTIEEDLSRRDFTINAIAYDPIRKKIIDLFNGQKDLKKKIIRTVGNPLERFKEDGLRPIRACRFAAKLNFKIEKETLNAINRTLDITKKVSVERIHDELVKIMQTPAPSIAIDLMRQTGILKIFIPELLEGIKIRQPKPFHCFDVYWHSLKSCDFAPIENPLLRLTALLHDIAKPECCVGLTFYNHEVRGEVKAKKILRRLKFSNADIKKISHLIRQHMFLYTKDWSDAALRRFVRRVGEENLKDIFLLRQADVKAMAKCGTTEYLPKMKKRIQKILQAQNALSLKDLAVNGHDIIQKLKIKPGPKIGEILRALLEKVLDNPQLNQKETLLKLAKEHAS